MSEAFLGIDLNGIHDRWALLEGDKELSFSEGGGVVPSVVVAPHGKSSGPLAGEEALMAIEGRGWKWPEEAAGPDSDNRCRRIPLKTVLETMAGRTGDGSGYRAKEIEVAKGEALGFSRLIGAHISHLISKPATSAVIAIPDCVDETFQQRVLESRYELGLQTISLLWRPVAMLLAWAQDLAKGELLTLHNSKVLVMYLDASGLQASILDLEVQETKSGPLLTPVRSEAGIGFMEGGNPLYEFVKKISGSHPGTASGHSLEWQMLWGGGLIWRGLLGLPPKAELIQEANGRWLLMDPVSYSVSEEGQEDFIASFENVLARLAKNDLSQVDQVLIGGPFLGIPCVGNQGMASLMRQAALKRLTKTPPEVSVHILSDSVTKGCMTSASARGAAISGWRLAHELPTYYDFLPQLRINAEVEDKPEFVDLVPKNTNRIPGGADFSQTVTERFVIKAGTGKLHFYPP